MYKYFVSSILIAVFVVSNAFAQNIYTPYVGINGVYSIAKTHLNKPQYFGGGFNIGTTYNDYFGTEVFYEQVLSESKKISDTQKEKTSYRAYGLDAVGYLPLDNDKRFALTGMVGIGEYVFHQKITNQNRHHNSAWGYRAGAGFIYRFSNNISMRMTAKYVGLDKIADFDHQVSYQIGLRYSFTKD